VDAAARALAFRIGFRQLPRPALWSVLDDPRHFDLGSLGRLRRVYSRGTSPALTDPSVRQWLANAVFLHTGQRRRSFAKANRASHLSGCPGQLGPDGQASGIFRSCQRDLRSKITSHSCLTGCSAGKKGHRSYGVPQSGGGVTEETPQHLFDLPIWQINRRNETGGQARFMARAVFRQPGLRR
jgi:hypothetical protein